MTTRFQLRRASDLSRPSSTPRRRSIRPRLEALEGRVVLTASLLDPTFGQAGVVLGPLGGQSVASGGTSNVIAVAPESDGKIIVAGTRNLGSSNTSTDSALVVERYNANGSLDATFGTNGLVNIPVGSFSTLPSSSLTINPDGSIILGASLGYYPMTSPATFRTLVARVTATGQLDSSFATNGEYVFPSLGAVAVQTDGKVLIAGTQTTDVNSAPDFVAIARLTTAGALDPSFGSAGKLTFELANDKSTTYANTYKSVAIAALAVGSTGSISLGTELLDFTASSGPIGLTRITGTGTLDTTFGTNGSLAPALARINTLVVQPDGKLLVAGQNSASSFSSISGEVTRLNPDGTTDPTFAGIAGTATTGLTTRFGPNVTIALGADGKIAVASDAVVGRLLATGTLDPSFGVNGITFFDAGAAGNPSSPNYRYRFATTVALTGTDEILAGGRFQLSQGFVAEFRSQSVLSIANDYDGDAKSDVAAYLPSLGIEAYRPSGGGADVLTSFGTVGKGNSIPAPGDYDGDGKADLSVYLPKLGVIGYRPSSGIPDTLIKTFNDPSIPAPGDYDGDGITDVAAYNGGIYKITSSATGRADLMLFGGYTSIPAPGDYDGDGKTDLAVYLPDLGALGYRPSSGGKDMIIPFGQVGTGASIPVPGDYDGDGKTDLAVYIPSLAQLIYRPSKGGTDVVTAFGQVGAGASIPAPGDYDGDGRTDVAVYIPSLAQFIYRPSTGGKDLVTVFGITGTGATIPSASIPYAQPSSTGGTSGRGTGAAAPSAVVYIPLTAESTVPTPTAKKKTTGTI